MKINAKSLLYGTLILTLANFIVRILGFIYRVLLSRMIGPQGMGLIQLVFPAYLITITLTTSGLPIAVSRLVSERKAKGDENGIRRIVAVALLLVVGISLVLSTLTLLNLDWIAKDILKDARTRGALFVFFPSIMIIGLGAVLKGYFYGNKDIHPPAIAEIVEQIVRMIVALGLLYWLAPKDYALAAVMVIVGMVIGEMASLLFLHYRYHKVIRLSQNKHASHAQDAVLSGILAIALPITLTRLASSFMTAANAILIPQRLMAGGMASQEAIGLFGIMSGMVMPLLFLPFTITSALAVVMIPNLSENLALKNWRDIRDKVSKALTITCITAFPSAALLISLGKPLGDLLYRQPMVGILLIPTAYSLLFHALQHTSSGILNGLGKQNRGAAHFIIGSTLQLGCTYFLVANPSYSMNGFIIGFFVSSILVSTLNLTTVLRMTGQAFEWIAWILKPGFSALLMASVTRLIYGSLATSSALPVPLNLTFSCLLGLLVFFLSLFLLGGMPTGLIKDMSKTKPG